MDTKLKYAPYSFSKISLHDQCNRKFYYRYVAKIKPEMNDLTALLKGGAIHSIIEKYPEKSTHKLASKYEHFVKDFLISDLGKKYLDIDSIKEYKFGLTRRLNPTTYNDKKALFRGFIDFVGIINDELFVVDWKSGKMKEEKWQNFEQLLFYAIYFFKKYEKIDIINISYVYVEHNHENILRLERKYLNNYIKDLIVLIKNAENDEDFNKNKTKLCDYCQFKNYCFNDVENININNI